MRESYRQIVLVCFLVGLTAAKLHAEDRPLDYSEHLPSGENVTGSERVLQVEHHQKLLNDLLESKKYFDQDPESDDHRAELYSNVHWFLEGQKKDFATHKKDVIIGHIERDHWGKDLEKIYRRMSPRKRDTAFDEATRTSPIKTAEVYERLRRAYAPLDMVQASAIVEYSEWNWQSMNHFLWSPESYLKTLRDNVGDDPEYFRQSLERLDASLRATIVALNELPSPEEGLVVFRCDTGTVGSREPPQHVVDFFRAENQGKVMLFRGFKSTTRGELPMAIEKYVANCPFLRIITLSANSRGKDIVGLSTRPWEEEILFLPNTSFENTRFELREAPVMEMNYDTNTLEPSGETFTQRVMHMKEIPLGAQPGLVEAFVDEPPTTRSSNVEAGHPRAGKRILRALFGKNPK